MKRKLLKDGEELFKLVVSDLNKLDVRTKEEFRREVDWKEICLALALLKSKI